MTNTVLLHIEDHLATITLNRPQQMNTYNRLMAEELERVTIEVMRDNAVRAVVLQGAGHLFMAGGDISFFYDNLEHIPNLVPKIMGELHSTIEALQTMPKPVIASVHGSVAGVGISFMLASDLVIAASDTKFSTAYSNIGLSPDGGLSYFLPRNVGTKKAMQLFLLGELFDAEMAEELGLINWRVPKEDLIQETNKLAQRLANGPTQAYASIKKLVNQTTETSLTQQLKMEETHFINCSKTHDFRVGVEGFMRKQSVAFKGI